METIKKLKKIQIADDVGNGSKEFITSAGETEILTYLENIDTEIAEIKSDLAKISEMIEILISR